MRLRVGTPTTLKPYMAVLDFGYLVGLRDPCWKKSGNPTNWGTILGVVYFRKPLNCGFGLGFGCYTLICQLPTQVILGIRVYRVRGLEFIFRMPDTYSFLSNKHSAP